MSFFWRSARSQPLSARRANVHAAWLVSVQSIVWTMLASSAAVVLGVAGHTVVLVALGGVGLVDGIGSAALVYHFHHARRHDQLSERIEKVAHYVVILGLLFVGLGTIIISSVRLAAGNPGGATLAGAVLAAVSVVALIGLARRKRVIAELVASRALRSDSHLSRIGATQAGIALVGAAATHWFAWDWADASAALLVGCIAVALAVATWAQDLRGPTRPTGTLDIAGE
jgi:divalent metal cation (Fe/Co/Zn/Cd) transporter